MPPSADRPNNLPFRAPRNKQQGTKDTRDVPEPLLPRDHEVDLPKGVAKELERYAGNSKVAGKLALALSAGTACVADGDLEGAAPLLEWVKHEAPRSGTAREAVAILRYQQGRFQDALRELQAYQRITGRKDQNHLVADCMRAVGRDVDQIGDVVAAMADSFPDRYVEGLIVWASALADRGEEGAGAALLRREVDDQLRRRAGAEAAIRLRYVEGDLAARAGRTQDAIAAFEEVVEALGEDAYDAPERLAELRRS